jgi:hypothetical protein
MPILSNNGDEMTSENGNRASSRTPRGREARDAAIDLFVKKQNADTRSAEIAKMARLRALRLAKEADDKAR